MCFMRLFGIEYVSVRTQPSNKQLNQSYLMYLLVKLVAWWKLCPPLITVAFLPRPPLLLLFLCLFCRIKWLKTFTKMHNVYRGQRQVNRWSGLAAVPLFHSLTKAGLLLQRAVQIWRRRHSFHSSQSKQLTKVLCAPFPSWQPGSFLTLPCCFLLAVMPFISHLIHLYLALFNYIFSLETAEARCRSDS